MAIPAYDSAWTDFAMAGLPVVAAEISR